MHSLPLSPLARRAGAGLAALCLTGGLAACGSSDGSSGRSSGDSSAAASSGSSQAAPNITEAWAKAVPEPSGEMPMTGVFGVVHNPGSTPLTITGGSSSAAKTVELHEMVKNDSGQMMMRKKEGGFQVPAGGALELKPGGNHVMLMGLTGPLKNGTTVKVTLQTSAADLEIEAAVRTYSAANESYLPGTGHS